MEGIYKVNLIPNDLSVEETVLQIADTLDNLNCIIDDVFSRISTRINRNMEKTSKLQERIEISRNKVEKIVGMQKAIKVFSSAKYPSSIVHEHYESIFDTDVRPFEPPRISLRDKTQRQRNEKEIQEKLHFFHVKVAEPKAVKPKHEYDLKSVVNKVASVGDLLIFNTDESVYFGSQKTPAYVPKVPASVQKDVLDEAPPSIMKKNVLKREIDEYMYAPGMGMVPELDMPMDLPHLPGVAGDIQYLYTDAGSIAPSAVTSPVVPSNPIPEHIPELPDLPDLSAKLDVPDIPDAPPVMPDPVVPEAPSAPIPPPPPPPPPPMEPQQTKEEKREAKQQKSSPPPSTGDAHASLMAAIRQAGGVGRAKLKPAAESTPAAKGKAVSGDLMADLHARLSMRRRGISGAERAADRPTGSLLHTLAAVIPEPESSPQTSSEDDWE
ncbi:WASH complex subunit 1 isoform X2 [Aricia agestis]|nr:WASH complex subunit 1 isoform X2 [Aricia agestis]